MAEKQPGSLYQRVTDHILQAMRANPAAPWVMPWQARPATALPRNALTGKHYRGINTVVLWCAALERGYESEQWVTLRQCGELGGRVRKGEKATLVVLWKVDERPEKEVPRGQDEETPRERVIARAYHVFNADQCAGLALAQKEESPLQDRIAGADRFFLQLGADIRHGGGEAYYSVDSDYIRMPRIQNFTEPVAYYSVLAHEFGHWTGADHRLARDLTGRFGTEAYAAEELVAELSAAFLLARYELSATPRPDHAHYCAPWCRLLGQDPRAIFTAAARAQEVADFLEREHERQASQGQLQACQHNGQAPHLAANEPSLNPVSETCSDERQQPCISETSTTMSEVQDPQNETNQQNASTEPKLSPLYELKLGKLQGHIYHNQNERGDYFTLTLTRAITGPDGSPKTSHALREQDIPAAVRLLQEAQKCIRGERGENAENCLQVTRSR
jgi:antirestriction protein ArdC